MGESPILSAPPPRRRCIAPRVLLTRRRMRVQLGIVKLSCARRPRRKAGAEPTGAATRAGPGLRTLSPVPLNPPLPPCCVLTRAC